MDDLPANQFLSSSSVLVSEFVGFIDGVRYDVRPLHHTAVAIFGLDILAEPPETIIVRGSTWSVTGTDDPEIGHRRSHFHIPNSISWISHCSFRDSFVESIEFGLPSALRVLCGLINCCVERLTRPSSVEVIEE
jgi:hypothetical protein